MRSTSQESSKPLIPTVSASLQEAVGRCHGLGRLGDEENAGGTTRSRPFTLSQCSVISVQYSVRGEYKQQPVHPALAYREVIRQVIVAEFVTTPTDTFGSISAEARQRCPTAKRLFLAFRSVSSTRPQQ